ncbi:MAG: beta-hexosaminidase [Bacilli bacterium]|nr:beta-hexosaminidase [Bacilli bacterium]
MNRKVIISIITITLFLTLILLNNKFNNHEEVLETNYLTSTVINIDNNQVTLQDSNNIIYTFLMDNESLLIGESIELVYKGELNKNKEFQENEVIDFKVLEPVNGNVPDLWLDNGMFSKFYNLAYKKLETMTLEEKIGQILLVRVPTTKQIEDLKKYNFGGYLLFERDFLNKTKKQVINMIQEFQDNSKIPLLIAVDEEGGRVSRISSNSNLVPTPFKSPRELYLEGGFELIKNDTISKSKILEELGINLNLAPVVDVSTNQNDYIYERTLGESSSLTSDYARTVINASKNGKVSYTLKHFPGYGNNEDTHLGISVDTRSLESIKNNDLPPFKAGIESGSEAVLVSHNIVSAIDKNMPASLSSSVHNLLRRDLNFTGIIITDDLSMQAISNNYPDTYIIDAIQAGNDLLIVTNYEDAFNIIKTNIQNNTLSQEQIDKMAFRILAWKYSKGLIIPNQK